MTFKTPSSLIQAFTHRFGRVSFGGCASVSLRSSSHDAHARGLLASLMLCLSFGALAQNYYTGPGSPIHTFGQRYAQAAQVVDSQSRMVFYRTRQSSSVGEMAQI